MRNTSNRALSTKIQFHREKIVLGIVLFFEGIVQNRALSWQKEGILFSGEDFGQEPEDAVSSPKEDGVPTDSDCFKIF